MFLLIVFNGCEIYSLFIEVEESVVFELVKIMILDMFEGCLDILVLSGNFFNGVIGIWGVSFLVVI